MEISQLLNQGYRYALSLTHNPALAEDLLQDAWESMLKLSAPQEIAYLITTIRNKFLNHKKRENVIPFLSLDESVSEAELMDSDADFSEVMANKDLLEQKLAELDLYEREVLYLFYYEEYSTTEIAELVGSGKGVVCSLIYRSRSKLRKLLEAEMPRVAL